MQEKPENIEGAKSLKPDFWLNPVHVWEVKYDQLTVSPVYKVGSGYVGFNKGISLRFGRFVRKREDKDANNSTSYDLLEERFRVNNPDYQPH